MYVPEAFALREREVLHAWMRRHPFAVLVTATGGVPEATHVPLWLDETRGEHGTLLGHVARANPQWRGFDGATGALAVFSGPHAYVSPRSYVGPGVPTWDYVAVHAAGAPRVLDDESAVRGMLRQLTEAHDGAGGYAALDAALVAKMLRGIVAFELPIDRLVGTQKLSQNRSEADRAGVIAALRASNDPDAHAVARLVEQGSAA